MLNPEQEGPNLWGAIGGFSAALAVILGAFGAHMLEGQVNSSQMNAFETAAQYHLIHAVGLVAISMLQPHLLRLAAPLILAGMVLFSGSLYAFALTGIVFFGAITPLGGVSFIAGWGAFGLAALRGRKQP
jgi:uncharacterized membrane protein YgdD (TMEM256/DUF423 family)